MRELQGLSRAEVARRSGFTTGAISKLEKKGAGVIADENMENVYQALGVICDDSSCFFQRDTYFRLYLPENIPVLAVDYDGLDLVLNTLLNVMGSRNIELITYYFNGRAIWDRATLDKLLGEPARALIIRDIDTNILMLFRRKLLNGYLPFIKGYQNEWRQLYQNVVFREVNGANELRTKNVERDVVERLVI